MHAAMAGMSGPYGPIQQPRVMMYPPPPVYSPPPMPYAMPPLTRPRRFSLRQIGGLVFGLIGVLLVVVALLGTWWYVGLTGFSGSIPITLPVNFGLFGGSANLFIIVLPLSYTGQWATVFLLTAVIVIAGLIMATTAVVLGFVSRNAGLRWASVGLAVGAFALLLVAPLYLMVALPGAQGDNPLLQLPSGGTPFPGSFSGFWGSETIPSGTIPIQVTWGGGWGWYLSFIAAALVLGAGILFAPSRAVTPTGYQPEPYPSAPGRPQTPAPTQEPPSPSPPASPPPAQP